MHLHDPRESILPAAGLLTIEDAETGELLEVDSSRAAVREKFADTNAERLAELDRALAPRRGGYAALQHRRALRPNAPGLLRDPAREEKGMKGRSPKSEGRSPKEIRRPRVEARKPTPEPRCAALDRADFAFGFRISAFLRPSDFGLRTLPIASAFSPPNPSLPAATNSSPRRHPSSASAACRDTAHFLGTTRPVGYPRRTSCCWRWSGAAVWFLTRPKPPVIVPPEVQARAGARAIGPATRRRRGIEPGFPGPAPLCGAPPSICRPANSPPPSSAAPLPATPADLARALSQFRR